VTPALPSLEAPPHGTTCPACGEELRIVGWCATCYEREMVKLEAIERQRRVRADFERARARTRAWRHARAVSA
jgi:transcription initiation factor IIE alpha subunit